MSCRRCICNGFSIPKGLHHSAQGCEERATLGGLAADDQPRRGCALVRHRAFDTGSHNPFGVEVAFYTNSQGSSFLATLGYATESRWDSRTIELRLECRLKSSTLGLSGFLTNVRARASGTLSGTQRGCARGRARSKRTARFPKMIARWTVFILLVVLAAARARSDERPRPQLVELAREVRDKGWIVYGARTARGDWDLFHMRPDGSEVRNLTNTPEFNEGLPRFSPDGTRILYRRIPVGERFDNNRHGLQGELVFANRDGSAVEVFGKEGEFSWASWSPEGRRIVCLSARGIEFYDLATKTLTAHLDRNGIFQQIIWSPDGKWLSGVANSLGTGWSVVRMEVATGTINPVSRVDCCTPDWFPDSQAMIYSSRPHAWTQLWMADGEGKQRRLVYAEEGRHIYGGCISPDGNYILFTGNKEEDGDPRNAGAPMGLLRLRDAPMITGVSEAARKGHHDAKDGPVLTLPAGWEPHWTAAKPEPPK
jgi:Tol biopolymer transport system component